MWKRICGTAAASIRTAADQHATAPNVTTDNPNTAADWRDKPELSEIMAGKVAGRKSDADVTCMLNHLGLGLQFSAAAARIYELAKARGLGRDLPGEWFCQDEHS